MTRRILIVGVGNLLLGDEGIGVHVARELSRMDLDDQVEVVEIGTAIFELATLMKGKDKVIIIDAILSNHPPGTVHKLTFGDLDTGKVKLLTSLHKYGLTEALEAVALTGHKPEVVLIGVVPKDYRTPGGSRRLILFSCATQLMGND